MTTLQTSFTSSTAGTGNAFNSAFPLGLLSVSDDVPRSTDALGLSIHRLSSENLRKWSDALRVWNLNGDVLLSNALTLVCSDLLNNQTEFSDDLQAAIAHYPDEIYA